MALQLSVNHRTVVSPGHRKVLLDMLTAYMKPQLLYVAAKLGIPDLLQDNPLTAQEISSFVNADPVAFQRFLSGLISIEVIKKNAQDKYYLTPLGEYLITDFPGSLRDVAILQGEELSQAWNKLLYTVQTGKPAFTESFGATFFSYFAQTPQVERRFNRYMKETGNFAAKALCNAYDFSRYNRIIDLGGGNGVILATLLKSFPHLQGTVFDITTATDDTISYLKQEGVLERSEVIQGDFFQAVPEGGDLYLLSQIFHDWDDERVSIILANCRKAMGDKSRLLLYENIMPVEVGADPQVIWQDLVMLVLTGGKERTEAEFTKLLQASGFTLEQISPTKHPRFILEARPI